MSCNWGLLTTYILTGMILQEGKIGRYGYVPLPVVILIAAWKFLLRGSFFYKQKNSQNLQLFFLADGKINQLIYVEFLQEWSLEKVKTLALPTSHMRLVFFSWGGSTSFPQYLSFSPCGWGGKQNWPKKGAVCGAPLPPCKAVKTPSRIWRVSHSRSPSGSQSNSCPKNPQ